MVSSKYLIVSFEINDSIVIIILTMTICFTNSKLLPITLL